MSLELKATAPSSGSSVIRSTVGFVGTAAASLLSIVPTPPFSGIESADAAHSYFPRQRWIQYETGLSSGTSTPLEVVKRNFVEQLVIRELDSIFEDLLVSQQDLDQADYNAIASNLWDLYK